MDDVIMHCAEDEENLDSFKGLLKRHRYGDSPPSVRKDQEYRNSSSDSEDGKSLQGKEELVHIIRTTVTSAEDDREHDKKGQNIRSLLTAALVQQFDNGSTLSVDTSVADCDSSSEQSQSVRSALSPSSRPAEDLQARRSLQQVRFEEFPVKDIIEDEVPEPASGPPPMQSIDEFDLSDDEGQGHSSAPVNVEARLSVSVSGCEDIPFIDDSGESENGDECVDNVKLKLDEKTSQHALTQSMEVDKNCESNACESAESQIMGRGQRSEVNGNCGVNDWHDIRKGGNNNVHVEQPSTSYAFINSPDECEIINSSAKTNGSLKDPHKEGNGVLDMMEVESFDKDEGLDGFNMERSMDELHVDISTNDVLQNMVIRPPPVPAPRPRRSITPQRTRSQKDTTAESVEFENNTEQQDDSPGQCSTSRQPDNDGDDVAMVTDEPLSHKEVLASKEEESSKERASTSSSLDDLDFSLLQSSNPSLNLLAGKDRAQLRQRGSLAQRRKPTRPSVRPQGPDEDIFAPPKDSEQSTDIVMNGHSSTSPPRDSEEMVSENMAGSSLLTSQPLPGIHKGIVLPGLGAGVTPKLRSKPLKPLPGEFSGTESTSSKPDTPPWFGHSKLRKTRPPKGEVEKLKQETEPETPAWMKDAEAKRKRASAVMQAKKANYPDSETSPGPSSGIKPSPLRKVPLPDPLPNKAQPDHVSSAAVATSSHDKPSDLSENTQSQAMDLSEPLQEPTEDVFMDEETPVDVRESKELAEESSSQHDHSRTPPQIPSKMVLPPIQSTGPSANISQSQPAVPAWKSEIAARRKSKTFTPIPIKPEPAIAEEDAVPPWKREIAERRKNRKNPDESQVSPAQSPSTGTAPWMLEVEQRKKRSLTSSGGTKMINPLMLGTAGSNDNQETELPDWAKVAAERRAKRKNSTGFAHLSVSDDEEV